MPTAPLAGVLGFNSAVSSPCHPLWFTYRSLWRTHNHSRWLGPRFVLCAKRRPDPGTWTRKRAFTVWHHSFINFGLDTRHITGAPIHGEWKWSAKGSGANPKNRLRSSTGCWHRIICPKFGLQLEELRSDINVLRDGQAIVNEPSERRLQWRAWASFGFEIVHFIKSRDVVSGAARRR